MKSLFFFTGTPHQCRIYLEALLFLSFFPSSPSVQKVLHQLILSSSPFPGEKGRLPDELFTPYSKDFFNPLALSIASSFLILLTSRLLFFLVPATVRGVLPLPFFLHFISSRPSSQFPPSISSPNMGMSLFFPPSSFCPRQIVASLPVPVPLGFFSSKPSTFHFLL